MTATLDDVAVNKTCSKCGNVKFLDEFQRRAKSPDGRMSWCRECYRAYYHSRYRGTDLTEDKRRALIDTSRKRCRKCNTIKLIDEFAVSKKGLLGRKAVCRQCSYDPAYGRKRNLKRYGMTVSEFDSRFESQGSRCLICHSDDPYGREFVVDHDHNTGKVRGILCNKCNPAIGMMDDDPDRLEAAAKYIRKFSQGAA